jgi:hypothetical protein
MRLIWGKKEEEGEGEGEGEIEIGDLELRRFYLIDLVVGMNESIAFC